MPFRFFFSLFILMFMVRCGGLAQKTESFINVVPQPVSVNAKSGDFLLSPRSEVRFPAAVKAEWEPVAKYLSATLQGPSGFALPLKPYDKWSKKVADDNALCFVQDPTVTAEEGYTLEVSKSAILIRARTAVGAFYAVQTLRQLFPPQVYNARRVSNVAWKAPCCVIQDAPRFSYRGMHLDVGRHYFPPAFVKRYIDLLAMHKMNRFHWHLTEDQGWRIEIKKYPKLQSVASCRKETLVGHYTDRPVTFDGKQYCGYYTQKEVQEIVEYARQRFITIVPEIEMPGHARAALSAYPELGCTGGPYEAATTWGVFDEVFCAGKEETFTFLDDVLEEVCALFPGQYVHVGGDECPKASWEKCDKCQARMKTEKLKDEHELQSYFIKRAGQMLAKRNKKLIGWDEILEGGLAENATVMSWRGTEGGIAAAKQGHDVVMTPGSHCYFDYYQADPSTEPVAIGGFLTLEKVYSYDPVPTELTPEEAKHILGAQGNVWTEYITTPEYCDYMVYPRACALAEVVWTPVKQKDWKSFSKRLQAHFSRLDVLKVNYAKAFFGVSASFNAGKVSLIANDPALQIRYTTNGKPPTSISGLYTMPLAITKSTTVKAATFLNGRQMGKVMSTDFMVHKASGKSYTLGKNPEKYTGGDTHALTNGVRGGRKNWDAWIGLVNRDIDPLIDFGATTTFSKVTFQYMNAEHAWIYPPKGVEVLVSDDGKAFKSVASWDIVAPGASGPEQVVVETPGAKGRYVKVVVKTSGVIPAGKPGAGEGAWLFVDEVIVE